MHMKNNFSSVLLWITIAVAVTGTGVCGFFAGRLYETMSRDEHAREMEKRERLLALRTEKYQPSCKELKHQGLPSLTKQDHDYYFVHTRSNYYHVVGINTDPEKPPVTYWWGAGLASALAACTDDK